MSRAKTPEYDAYTQTWSKLSRKSRRRFGEIGERIGAFKQYERCATSKPMAPHLAAATAGTNGRSAGATSQCHKGCAESVPKLSVASPTVAGMTIAAYVRVSTSGQTTDQQLDQLAAVGITADRVFTDTASGRAGSDRPGWRECQDWLREGDVLVVTAVDRLGRSVHEVAQTLHELTARGVTLRSLREGVDTGTPTGKAVVQIMATVAELELDLGKERRAASREARTSRGLPATRPPKLDAAQSKRLTRLYDKGEPVSELVSLFGVSRRTVFRTIARHREDSVA